MPGDTCVLKNVRLFTSLSVLNSVPPKPTSVWNLGTWPYSEAGSPPTGSFERGPVSEPQSPEAEVRLGETRFPSWGLPLCPHRLLHSGRPQWGPPSHTQRPSEAPAGCLHLSSAPTRTTTSAQPPRQGLGPTGEPPASDATLGHPQLLSDLT